MSLDSSGAIAASWAVDSSTIEISSNTVQVKSSGIGTTQIANAAVTTAKIADGNVTPAKLSSLNYSLSSSCGTFTTTSTSLVDVTNLLVTLTGVTGRPVMVMLMPETGVDGYISITGGNYIELALINITSSTS